jgi:hypothetical protein
MTYTTHPRMVRGMRRQGKAGATPKNDNPYILPSTCQNSHSTMVNVPAVKQWCQDDKNKLQKLIGNGKVDISKTDNIDYIDRFKHNFFRKRDNANFRRNFRN